MRISKNYVQERDNISVIYSGFNSISDKGREQLKNIAESLITIQNRPGTPVPENISQEIMRDSTNDLFLGGEITKFNLF